MLTASRCLRLLHNNSLNEMVERLPEPGWKHLSFPELSGKAIVTDRIDIRSTGIGNQERESRIEGRDSTGASGFYHRKLDEKNWQFTPSGGPVTGSPVSPGSSDPSKVMTEPLTMSFDRAEWSGDMMEAPV